MTDYLVVLAVVFAVNLLPAFGPPTWAVLVFFHLHGHLYPAALVAVGALAAGCGRYTLAWGTRRLRGRLSAQRQASLHAAGHYLSSHRARSVLGLALFALSPLPSAQPFEAAGLLQVPLAPITVSFSVGRLVSYSLYIGAASLAEDSLTTMFGSAFTSPAGVALQIGMLVAVALLARIDWVSRLMPRSPRPGRGTVESSPFVVPISAFRGRVTGSESRGGTR